LGKGEGGMEGGEEKAWDLESMLLRFRGEV